MSEAIRKIENILKSPYSPQGFLEFVNEIFDSLNPVDPNGFQKEFSNFSSHIEGSTHVGNYSDPDGKKIAVFAIQLKTAAYVENSRSTQRSFVRKLLEDGNCDAAIVAFYAPNETKWRLSFVRLDYEMKFDNGRFRATENLTPAKRFSFLVGKDEPCYTAISRFRNFIIDENYNPTLDEIEEAFSVEKVTKEFFEQYCEKFYQLQEYLDGNQDFVEEATRCGFTSEQFAKKLMGQIVFLYFLQKKGWLGVNVWPKQITEKEYNNVFYTSGVQGRTIKDYLPRLYVKTAEDVYQFNPRILEQISDEDEETIAKHMPRNKTWGDGSKCFLTTIFDWSQKFGGRFYDDYLEPLFYNSLNKNRGSFAYCPELHCRVPFLSGGLFEPIDNYDWKSSNFDIPDEMFSNRQSKGERDADGILDIFDRYNFTISEDEPMEREVAIDPEMLGKVFENLLEVKDRKTKGAFYTPREIVHYMSRESLINYLVRKTKISEEAIRDFIIYGDFMKDEDTSKDKREGNGGMYISEELFKVDTTGNIIVNRLQDVDDALAMVRIADPAVGSGAFPLGMMNEIVKARQNITAYLTIGMKANDKRLTLMNERSAYSLKRHAIKNSIFAVDIEPSAVDIAQLRLWLSLVIDDEINPDAQNELEGHRDPLPLPNLECNILCGNSLIDEFMGVKLLKESEILGTTQAGTQIDFLPSTFETAIKKLLEEQDKLFSEDDTFKKDEEKRNIQAYKDLIINEQLHDASPEILESYEIAKKQTSKPFVLWQLDFARVFRMNGGFDIVIGNPPYVSTKGQDEKEKKKLTNAFGYADDLYYHFIDKSFSLLRPSGNTCFITPDTYFTTLTKAPLRELLTDNRIVELVQLGQDVFESAMVSTAIILVKKELSDDGDEIKCIDVKNKKSITDGTKYIITKKEFLSSINGSFYMPTCLNRVLIEKLQGPHSKLVERYFPMISTSRDIEKNAVLLNEYRASLKPGDWTLIGLVTEGGQGLATANNGRFVGVRTGTKEANRILETRVGKLAEVNARYGSDYSLPANEQEVWALFEAIKEKYGRDVFGQGYLYKIVPNELIRDAKTLSEIEKEKGIETGPSFVTYDKGDKDGNRWYNETPYLINWSKENVSFLKENSGKKGTGMPVVRNSQFYFREGFSYSDIKTFFLKCRLKGVSVHDVKSMSLFPVCEKTPYYYIITLINTEIIATLVYNFLNNTPSFQINDCRMLPIPIPTNDELDECKKLFESAVFIQKEYFIGSISEEEREEKLSEIQDEIEKWACRLYDISPELLQGKRNFVR